MLSFIMLDLKGFNECQTRDPNQLKAFPPERPQTPRTPQTPPATRHKIKVILNDAPTSLEIAISAHKFPLQYQPPFANHSSSHSALTGQSPYPALRAHHGFCQHPRPSVPVVHRSCPVNRICGRWAERPRRSPYSFENREKGSSDRARDVKGE